MVGPMIIPDGAWALYESLTEAMRDVNILAAYGLTITVTPCDYSDDPIEAHTEWKVEVKR